MFDRAKLAVTATAALAAAAMVAVFAAGFALYALIEPAVGRAGAAAIVSLAAALAIALFALAAALRAQTQRREAEHIRADLMDELPANLGDLARDRPLLTVTAAAIVGVLAARHPALLRDVLAIVSRLKG
jgi:hypothetical protein